MSYESESVEYPDLDEDDPGTFVYFAIAIAAITVVAM